MVAVKEAVTADGAFIHLADTQRQLVAQSRRIAQAFAPVDGPENDGYLFLALRSRFLDSVQERINMPVWKHLFPRTIFLTIAAFKEMAAAHVREIIPVLGDQSGTVLRRVIARKTAKQRLHQFIVISGPLREREAAHGLGLWIEEAKLAVQIGVADFGNVDLTQQGNQPVIGTFRPSKP